MTPVRLVLGFLLLVSPAFAEKAAEKAAPAAPAPPPEIKKTVDTMVGKWALNTTLTMPGGAAPAKFPEKIECKKAVQGRAVTCTDTFNMPGAGPTEYAYLAGYDPETKSVHVFAIGSPGEVHDHKCAWKGDTLECEPYKGTSEGQPITEIVSFIFAGNNLTIRATVKTKDGDVVVESTGKRGK